MNEAEFVFFYLHSTTRKRSIASAVTDLKVLSQTVLNLKSYRHTANFTKSQLNRHQPKLSLGCRRKQGVYRYRTQVGHRTSAITFTGRNNFLQRGTIYHIFGHLRSYRKEINRSVTNKSI